ncbi:integrase, catalytic region, zinc finger, CCHC-type containing protein [Tanacetum coccineum]
MAKRIVKNFLSPEIIYASCLHYANLKAALHAVFAHITLSKKDTSKMDAVADEPVAEYVKEVDVTTKGVLYWEEGKLERVVVPVSADATQQEALLWLKNLKENLTSMYERFSTLITVMDRNEVLPPAITINTKFLNSLQPEWSKYVTMTRQKYTLKTSKYDELYDHLCQFEPHVNASKSKKATRNHDPLALVANSYAYSSYSHASSSYSHSPQPYYVTQPSSMVDIDDDYQGEIQEDAEEDKLTTAMMNARRQNRNQATNVGNGLVQSIEEYDHNVKTIPRIESTQGKTNVQCYNYNGKGHDARECPKPRVRDSKFFREQMLLATKDEAEVHLNEEENDYFLNNAYGDNTLDELNATVIMMACIQPTDDKSNVKPTCDSEFISEVNALQVVTINGLLSKSDHEQRHHEN